jgi:hypothetical protein
MRLIRDEDVWGPEPDMATVAVMNKAIIDARRAFDARCANGTATREEMAERLLDLARPHPERSYAALLAWVYAKYPTQQEFDTAMRAQARTQAEGAKPWMQ